MSCILSGMKVKSRAGGFRTEILAYVSMMVAATIIFLLVRSAGEKIIAPSSRAFAGAAPVVAQSDVLLELLIALVVVIFAARVCGSVCKVIHQPPVIGEIISGILIGPSLLGRVAPELSAHLLAPATMPFISMIAQLGVILFMFLVGLEMDTSQLKSRTNSVIAISHASITVPFVMGLGIALWLYPRLSTSDVPFTVFALFIGVSLSVTAFPVLARILTDRGLQKTQLGVLALTCAAVNDVTAWCLLAFLMAIVKARISGAAVTFGLTVAYIAFMVFVARPLIGRAVRVQERRDGVSQTAMAVVVIGILLSTLATQAAGIHAIFGAFVLGAIIPHDSRLASHLAGRLHDLVVVLFLPAFFAFTGMRTQIGLVHGGAQWLLCAMIFATASAGKFGGTFVAARLSRLSARDAASLGILMNTRGLMELIVLNVGLDLHIISPTLFAMLVLMAVATTLATTPVLQLVAGDWAGQRAPAGDSPPATLAAGA
jgi:Kef-type K+ transport system membrane component KefB